MATLAEIFDGEPRVIPVIEGRAYTSQRMTLDGRDYTLDLKWNDYLECWTFSLSDSELLPIVEGVRITTNRPLFRWYKSDDRMPPGELVAITLTNDVSDPGFDDFGTGKRVELTYFAQGV
jgi:hypothetical protein